MSETMMKGHAEGSSGASAGGSASGRATAVQTATDAAAWWQQHDQRVYQCIKLWVEQWWDPQQRGLLEAVGQVFGEHRASIRETLTNLKERIVRLETTSNFEERFTKLLIRSSAGPRFRRASCWLRSRACSLDAHRN